MQDTGQSSLPHDPQSLSDRQCIVQFSLPALVVSPLTDVTISGALQVRRNAHVEIIPLSTGCLGACTYCKTRHARGALGSYELDAIASRACKAAADPLVRVHFSSTEEWSGMMHFLSVPR